MEINIYFKFINIHAYHLFLRLFGGKGIMFVFLKLWAKSCYKLVRQNLYSSQGESLIMKMELKKLGTAKEI